MIPETDLRIDVYRPSSVVSGPVLIHSAVRVTHIPSGLVAICQEHKSMLANKEQAIRDLEEYLNGPE